MNFLLKRVLLLVLTLASSPSLRASDGRHICADHDDGGAYQVVNDYYSPPIPNWRYQGDAEDEEAADFRSYRMPSRTRPVSPTSAPFRFAPRFPSAESRYGRPISDEFQPHSNNPRAADRRIATPKWGGQKLCPVTGELLGSMGDPISVIVKNQTIWVCCDACVAAVTKSADKYLRKVADELAATAVVPNRSLRNRRVPPNAAESPIVRWGGQKVCPVTGEELGSMGEPIPVMVKGQTIFVCCRSCVAAVKRNPDEYVGGQ